uniref:Uncharacterized protein n=1 Tax=Anguilla anguilla TaxID=7936 RepID=A0A0E9VFS4_ANGAN
MYSSSPDGPQCLVFGAFQHLST